MSTPTGTSAGTSPRASPGRSWHAVTWLVWACAAATTVQLAPSPVYVALVVGVAALVVEVYAPDGPYRRAFPVLVGLGVAFALVRMLLTAATTHTGLHSQVLFTTPAFALPELLGGFTVGGSIELPVVLQSATEGFAIVGVMAVFGAFNAVVSHYELVQSSPRAFYEAGLVVTVALAFVPSTVRAVHDVREADRARTGGRAVRRGRLLRQAVPVLESGMERAVALAESMDSRGFAHAGASRLDHLAGWCGLGALVALGGAFVALVGRAEIAAVALGVTGACGLVTAVWLASATSRRARYRPRRMTGADWRLLVLALVAPVAIAALALAGDRTLVWTASPLRWPGFHLVTAGALLTLLAPVLLQPKPARMSAPELAYA